MSDWGQGAKNNDIGWGQGAVNNDISWGAVHEDSWSGDTDIVGLDPIETIINAFEERVALDGGTFEAESCLNTTLTDLNNDGLLEEASLVITPNAVEEGKIFSIKPTDGSGDLSVVRATTATEVGSDGVIQDVPYNLFSYSEQFENAYWTKTNGAITPNSIIAPNGTLTADLFAENTATGEHVVLKGNLFQGTGNYTFSGWVKSNGRNVRITERNNTAFGATFNLTNGTFSGVTGAGTTVSIQRNADGWCFITINFVFTTSINFQLAYNLTNDISTSYTGNGTSGIYLWGAQLVKGTEPKEYFPTTDRLNVPRLDYSNGSCPSILVEPQRTNLFLRSEEFNDGYWLKSNSSVVVNQIISPNGTLTADKLNDSVSNTTHVLFKQSPITGTNQTVTLSVFAKAGEYNFCSLSDNTTGKAAFNLTTGVNTYSDAGITANNSVYYGDGWWRLSITFTVTTARGCTINIQKDGTSDGLTFIGTGTSGIYIWGAQLEAGANATSYIPTVASAVTRNADVISKTGLSGITTITETFENGTTNVISGSPTSYTMSQGRIKQVIGI
jgi:hypothetical protein